MGFVTSKYRPKNSDLAKTEASKTKMFSIQNNTLFILEALCPGAVCHWGGLSVGGLSGAICPGALCPGAICPEPRKVVHVKTTEHVVCSLRCIFRTKLASAHFRRPRKSHSFWANEI